ncbi:hypothetical protein EBS02_03760 [bacterium]|nr:hypothetical protein [bacterium]
MKQANHLVPIRQDQILSFYYCQELFIQKDLNVEAESLDIESINLYMGQVKKWASSHIHEEDSNFFGGDEEDSEVVLYSSSLNFLVSCFAIRTMGGSVEPIFFTRKLPTKVRDNHLLIICSAIQALKDLGLNCVKGWVTNGSEHLPLVPGQENFDIMKRLSDSMAEKSYFVKTGKKCSFCPLLSSCEVYRNIETIQSLCSNGPARFEF